jgi:hypothetical protein
MQPIVTDSETLERFQHFLFVLPPLLLYALAVVLFEASVDLERPFRGCREWPHPSLPFWGVAFTTVLIGAYVPSALYLNKRAQALVRERGQAMTPAETEQWLSERGLSFKLSNQLAQYWSIIAPFLAAPLSATISFS